MMTYANTVQRTTFNPYALGATLLAVLLLLTCQAITLLSDALAQVHVPTISLPVQAQALPPERVVTPQPVPALARKPTRVERRPNNTFTTGEVTPSRLPGIGLTRSPPREFVAAHGETILRAASTNNLPPELIYAVIATESGFNPQARTSALGLMQIKAATARSVGFSGAPSRLFQPDVNIEYGTAYLAKAYRLAGGDMCRAVSLYNRGLGNGRPSPTYCKRVRDHIARYGHVASAPTTE